MKAIKRPDQYMLLRGDIWHYVRRVPKAVRHVDSRKLIYRSLETDSRKIARQLRDVCAAADDQRWSEIAPGRFGAQRSDAIYLEANRRAHSLGFSYEPMDGLVGKDTVEDLLRRLEALTPLRIAPAPQEEQDTEAVLGAVETPSMTITQAMELCLSEIAADELASKSPEQKRIFAKGKRRAVTNFVKVNGDVDMREITRDHAHALRKF